MDPMALLAGRRPQFQRRSAAAAPDNGTLKEPDAHEAPPAAKEESTEEESTEETTKAPPASRSFPVSQFPFSMSLAERCRRIIVSNLERYPPTALAWGLQDADEWDRLVTMKHTQTQPTSAAYVQLRAGGLDGTGRLTPALSARFVAAVQEAAPHWITPLSDLLIWKDCVNYRFRRISGNVSTTVATTTTSSHVPSRAAAAGSGVGESLLRPLMMREPWPLMVERILQLGAELQDKLSDTPAESLHALQDAPMNVALLRDTGIGKTVRKVIKAIQKQPQPQPQQQPSSPASKPDNQPTLEILSNLMQRWKAMAAADSTTATTTVSSTATAAPRKPSKPQAQPSQPNSTQDADDWKLAESCRTWKDLYHGLAQREERRRAALGQRLRANRQHLNADRPKIVKVTRRPVKRQQQHDRILYSGGQSSTNPANPRIQKLRQETATLMQRTLSSPQSSPLRAGSATSRPRNAVTAATNFAQAIALAGTAKKRSTAQRSSAGVSPTPKRRRTAAPTVPPRGKYPHPPKAAPKSPFHKPAF